MDKKSLTETEILCPVPIPMRIAINPSLLRWACDRSGRSNAYFAHRFPQWTTWLSEAAKPTFKQVQDFANASHTPIGLVPLPTPPVDAVPIPDFRTVANSPHARPSSDLLETISICQQRQEWYRDFARSMGETPRIFVGSLTISDNEIAAAERIRTTLGFDREARREASTWTEAPRSFIKQADTAGWRVEDAARVIKKVHKPGKARANPLRGLFAEAIDGKTCVVEYETDSELRDYEQIPLLEEGGIEAFVSREVLPYTPDAWIVEADTKIGYEVSFTRHFYQPPKLRTLAEISADILTLEQETEGRLSEITKGTTA